MFLNLSSLKSQLAEATSKEDLRYEKSKRRMSDFHTSLNAINHKLDFLVNNFQQLDPPEAVFNNPMMHERPHLNVPTGRSLAPEPRPDAPKHFATE
jgi:hypothetical protein